MPNQINAIALYWLDTIQTWVFDDERVGLVQEPFVRGADTFLTHLVADIPDARSGFRLLFSAAPLPGYQQKLIWDREEMGGNCIGRTIWQRKAGCVRRYFDISRKHQLRFMCGLNR